jgi:hypothetical protein
MRRSTRHFQSGQAYHDTINNTGSVSRYMNSSHEKRRENKSQPEHRRLHSRTGHGRGRRQGPTVELGLDDIRFAQSHLIHKRKHSSQNVYLDHVESSYIRENRQKLKSQPEADVGVGALSSSTSSMRAKARTISSHSKRSSPARYGSIHGQRGHHNGGQLRPHRRQPRPRPRPPQPRQQQQQRQRQRQQQRPQPFRQMEKHRGRVHATDASVKHESIQAHPLADLARCLGDQSRTWRMFRQWRKYVSSQKLLRNTFTSWHAYTAALHTADNSRSTSHSYLPDEHHYDDTLHHPISDLDGSTIAQLAATIPRYAAAHHQRTSQHSPPTKMQTTHTQSNVMSWEDRDYSKRIADRYRRMNLTGQVFDVWRDVLQHRATQRSILRVRWREWQNRAHHRTLLRWWTKWRKYLRIRTLSRLDTQKAQSQVFVSVIKRYTLKKALRSWHQITKQEQRDEVEAVWHWRQTRIAQAFSLWHRRTVKKYQVQRWIIHRYRRMARRYLLLWHQCTVAGQSLDLAAQMYEDKQQQSFRRRFLDWHHVTFLRRQIRTRTLHTTLRMWHQSMLASRVKRYQQYQLDLQREMFLSWRTVVRLKPRAQAVQVVCERNLRRRTFSLWLHSARKYRARRLAREHVRRNILHSFLGVPKNNRLVSVRVMLRQYWHDDRAPVPSLFLETKSLFFLRQQISIAYAYRIRRSLTRALQRWRTRATQTTQHHVYAGVAHELRCTTMIRRAIGKWKSRAASAKQLQFATDKIVSRRMRTALKHLCVSVHIQRQYRLERQKMLNDAGLWQRQLLLHKGLRMLQVKTRFQSRLRHLASFASQFRFAIGAGKAFRHWRSLYIQQFALSQHKIRFGELSHVNPHDEEPQLPMFQIDRKTDSQPSPVAARDATHELSSAARLVSADNHCTDIPFVSVDFLHTRQPTEVSQLVVTPHHAPLRIVPRNRDFQIERLVSTICNTITRRWLQRWRRRARMDSSKPSVFNRDRVSRILSASQQHAWAEWSSNVESWKLEQATLPAAREHLRTVTIRALFQRWASLTRKRLTRSLVDVSRADRLRIQHMHATMARMIRHWYTRTLRAAQRRSQLRTRGHVPHRVRFNPHPLVLSESDADRSDRTTVTVTPRAHPPTPEPHPAMFVVHHDQSSPVARAEHVIDSECTSHVASVGVIDRTLSVDDIVAAGDLAALANVPLDAFHG